MRRRNSLVAISATVGMLMLAGCSGPAQKEAGGSAVTHVKAGQVSLPAATTDVDSVSWYGGYRPLYTLDPIRTADDPESTLLSNVCEPVLTLDPSYTIQPGIAESWKQVSGTEVTLKIRPNAKFSDGSAVTAEDVAFSLNRVLDPANGSPFAETFRSVKSITATDPLDVTVLMSTPDYLFVNALTTVGAAVLSKAFTEAAGPGFGTPDTRVLCAGPYKVDSWNGSTKMVLTPNPFYWDTEHKPKAKTLTFLYPTEPSAVSNAIVSGEIQGAFGIPEDIVDTVASSGKGTLYVGQPGSSPQNIDLVISKLQTGPLADVRVRQALSLILDRKAIAKTIFNGLADPLYQVVGPGFWPTDTSSLYKAAYDKDTIKVDVAKAKQLVKDSGKSGATITIAYLPQQNTFTKIATIWQQSAKEIGLDLKIVAVPADQYGQLFVDKTARAAYDGFLTKNYIEFPSPTTMDSSYGSEGGFQNYGGYSNDQVTALVDQARGTEDATERAQLTIKAQAILSAELPWIPIVQPRVTVFLAKGLTGAPLKFSYLTSPWASAIGGKG